MPKKKTRQFEIETVGLWNTCIANGREGKVASIIMPSRTSSPDTSLTWCSIGRDGLVEAGPCTKYILAHSVVESDRPDWRNAAYTNAVRMSRMPCSTDSYFGLMDELSGWVSGLHGIKNVRFLLGGDMSGYGMACCMIKVASAYPGKRFIAVSSSVELLNDIWMNAQRDNPAVPENMQFYLEYPHNGGPDYLYGFPKAVCTLSGGQDELSAFPHDMSKDMEIAIPAESEAYIERKVTSWDLSNFSEAIKEAENEKYKVEK